MRRLFYSYQLVEVYTLKGRILQTHYFIVREIIVLHYS